jgi:hypothetical protein
MQTTKKFLNPNLLRLINFGGNQEASDRWFEQVNQQTADVHWLMTQGFKMHDAWMLVKGRPN